MLDNIDVIVGGFIFYPAKMSCVSASFLRCILVFFTLFAIQTLAKPGKTAVKNGTPKPTAIRHCNNVYFYAGPNKKIETLLHEMKKQLAQVQKDINILKGNKSSVKGTKFPVLYLRDIWL